MKNNFIDTVFVQKSKDSQATLSDMSLINEMIRLVFLIDTPILNHNITPDQKKGLCIKSNLSKNDLADSKS